MTGRDIAELQRGQLHYLRSVTEVPKSTPIAAVYPKFGVLPIQYEAEFRKLCFLKSILQKSHDDPVRMVHNEMLSTHVKIVGQMRWWLSAYGMA